MYILVKPLAMLCCSIVLTGCTAMGPDPLEPVNRQLQAFDNGADKVLIKPLAMGYAAVMPNPGERAVQRFFSNLAEPNTAANQLLQGRPALALNDAGRFLINSTVGLLGFFDVAQNMGLARHSEDFGQTLGLWGMPTGPYIVFPFRGPTTLRDFAGGYADTVASIPLTIEHVPTRNSLFALQIVTLRASLLTTPQPPAASDRYTLFRDFYLQRRQAQVQQ